MPATTNRPIDDEDGPEDDLHDEAEPPWMKGSTRSSSPDAARPEQASAPTTAWKTAR